MSGPATSILHFRDGRGNEAECTVRHTVDARDFLGTAIYPWLMMAANPHLSSHDLWLWLLTQARETPGIVRSAVWLKKRRWMTRPAGSTSATGPKRDSDGKTALALKIMAANPELSLRDLARLLKEHGITRSREFLRRHRCDHLTHDNL